MDDATPQEKNDIKDYNGLQRLLTPWRIKWYPRFVLAAIAIAFIIAVFSGNGASIISGRIGGDYAAFYGAGRIIAEGNFEELYNWKRQLDSQEGLFRGDEKSFLPFMNPPYVALAYLPLSLLPYRLSYVIHTLLMVGGLLMTLRLLRPLNAQIEQHYLCAFTLLLLFFPILRSVIGGQNTALTLLLIASSWRAVEDQYEFWAGFFLGLLLFKPHFALPLIGVYVLSGRWRVGITSGITAFFLYIIGILIQGPKWITIWFNYADWVIHASAGFEAEKAISWLEFFKALLGVNSIFASIIGWTMSLGTVLGISWIWYVGGRRANLAAQIGIAVPCLLLIPPHVYYYDAGLLFFTYAVLTAKLLKRKAELVGIVWFFSFSQVLSSLLGISPLFLVTVFTGVLAINVLGRMPTHQTDSENPSIR